MPEMTLERAREQARQAFDCCKDVGYSRGANLRLDKEALAALDRAIAMERRLSDESLLDKHQAYGDSVEAISDYRAAILGEE